MLDVIVLHDSGGDDKRIDCTACYGSCAQHVDEIDTFLATLPQRYVGQDSDAKFVQLTKKIAPYALTRDIARHRQSYRAASAGELQRNTALGPIQLAVSNHDATWSVTTCNAVTV